MGHLHCEVLWDVVYFSKADAYVGSDAFGGLRGLCSHKDDVALCESRGKLLDEEVSLVFGQRSLAKRTQYARQLGEFVDNARKRNLFLRSGNLPEPAGHVPHCLLLKPRVTKVFCLTLCRVHMRIVKGKKPGNGFKTSLRIPPLTGSTELKASTMTKPSHVTPCPHSRDAGTAES